MVWIRESWPWRPLFLLVLLSATASPDLLVKFPLLCYQNAGLTFFILFCIAWLLYATPLLGIEFALGHYLKGPMGLYGTFPILQAFAWSSMLYCFLRAVRLVYATAIPLYYTYLTITGGYISSVFSCSNLWNTAACCLTGTLNGTCSAPSFEFYTHIRDNSIGGFDVVTGAASVAVGVLAVLFLLVGPSTLAPLCSAGFLFAASVIAVLCVMLSKTPGSLELITSTLEQPAVSPALYRIDTWADAAFYVVRNSLLATGVITTLSSYNWPSRSYLHFVDLLLLCVLVPALHGGSNVLMYMLYGLVREAGHDTSSVDALLGTQSNLTQEHTFFGLVPLALGDEHRLYAGLLFGALAMLGLTTLVCFVDMICSAVLHSCECWDNAACRPTVAVLVSLGAAGASLVFSTKAYGLYQALHWINLYADTVYVALVFVELLIYLAYATLKLYQKKPDSYYDDSAKSSRLVQIIMLVLLVFFLMLVTILLLTYNLVTFTDTAERIIQQFGLNRFGPLWADWVLICYVFIYAAVGMLVTFLSLATYALISNRNLCELLFRPRIARSSQPEVAEMHNGEFHLIQNSEA